MIGTGLRARARADRPDRFRVADFFGDPGVWANLAGEDLGGLAEHGLLELAHPAPIDRQVSEAVGAEARVQGPVQAGRERHHGEHRSAELGLEPGLEVGGVGPEHDRGDTALVERHEHVPGRAVPSDVPVGQAGFEQYRRGQGGGGVARLGGELIFNRHVTSSLSLAIPR